MNKAINRAKIIFLGIFLVAAAGLWAYQTYYVKPRLECEEAHGWWSPELHACRKPVSLRPPPPHKPLPPIDSLRPTLPERANLKPPEKK